MTLPECRLPILPSAGLQPGGPVQVDLPLPPPWSRLCPPGPRTQLSQQRSAVGSPLPASACTGRSPASPSAPLAPGPQPGAAAPTEVEAFVLVLGVEEDALGVGVDVGAGRDEQRGDVSLPPLDGDVQRRLPCGRDRGGRLRSAAGTGMTHPLWPVPLSVLCTLHQTVEKY